MSQGCKISVIICTHNPQGGLIRRVIGALRAQTFPRDRWELLLIDNASDSGFLHQLDLDWHEKFRVVSEPTLGLTVARLRGIRESKGQILVFVDDDNILDQDYLTQVESIGARYPFLGAWGGSCIAETEIPPSKEIQPYLGFLAVRNVSKIVWSNLGDFTLPVGAGLCVRRQVAERYSALVSKCSIRRDLDRKGLGIPSSSSGDIDLALTAIDLGLGTGLFPELSLTHVIPQGRFSEGYMLNLIRGVACSRTLLNHARGEGRYRRDIPNFAAKTLMLFRHVLESALLRLPGFPFRIRVKVAYRLGERSALFRLSSGVLSVNAPILWPWHPNMLRGVFPKEPTQIGAHYLPQLNPGANA